jgi:hypothetical protein
MVVGMFVLFMMLSVGSLPLRVAGEPLVAAATPFDGHVKAIKINTCGLQLGKYQGVIVLANNEGSEVLLALTPETRIRNGTHLQSIDTVQLGDYGKGRATPIRERLRRRLPCSR